MTDWKFDGPLKQVDPDGNIVQIRGAVQPKACQNCHKDFDCPISTVPKYQSVPFYKCKDCDFKNAGGTEAFDHKLETSHNIEKIQENRLVGYEKKLTGKLIPHITHGDGDVKILCGDCQLGLD